jgi:hypothetical protein
MIAAPVQCDVDGVPKESHFRKSTAEGEHRRCVPSGIQSMLKADRVCADLG